MRKVQKDSILEIANLLQKAQEHVKSLLKQQEYASVLDLLQQCQQGAIQIGTIIEQAEGEGFVTVKMLEEYCELVFQVFEMVQSCAEKADQVAPDADVIFGAMDRLLADVAESIHKDINVRKEVVFLPYKASMWDSLESIWMAADADSECDVYVVPIPYFEKDPEGNLKVHHYEGDDFPEYVKVTHYNDYPLEEIHPDAVFIHNPYDHGNYVTSVHPRFYSYELKKYTDMLVYVPYYASSGGMSDGQALCSAYQHVDYIVTQSEEYIKYFDETIPREKILPFGSPKFDRALRLCHELPVVPLQWREKIEGKKVYFYNTSISGMLADTRRFLVKMEYVFRCFKDRKDACLLWRPHPLLEATFDSMRKEYRPVYESLKKYFIQSDIGIYDDTPDMEISIALSDAYIGDAGSSVISLFGITGKPIYILSNSIHHLPGEKDWKKEAMTSFPEKGTGKWQITQGNKLYVSEYGDYNFRYCMDLSEYAYGDYYLKAFELCGKVIVCPKNAQDILVIEGQKIARKIELKKCVQRAGSFSAALQVGHYLFLIPHRYPAIVRFNVITELVDYIEGYTGVFAQSKNGQPRNGGNCVWEDYILLASPVDERVLALHVDTLNVQLLASGGEKDAGCMAMIPDGENIWMLPIEGKTVKCWNPIKGSVIEYDSVPDGFCCKHMPIGYECDLRPYSSAIVTEKEVVLAPYWGNMFVKIDKSTGEVVRWETQLLIMSSHNSGYALAMYEGKFEENGGRCLYYSKTENRLYEVDIQTGNAKEVEFVYDEVEWKEHEPGFSPYSQWLRYCAVENATHTLPDFLTGKQRGNAFDKESQVEAFRAVASHGDGKTGERVYEFVKRKWKNS